MVRLTRYILLHVVEVKMVGDTTEAVNCTAHPEAYVGWVKPKGSRNWTLGYFVGQWSIITKYFRYSPITMILFNPQGLFHTRTRMRP